MAPYLPVGPEGPTNPPTESRGGEVIIPSLRRCANRDPAPPAQKHSHEAPATECPDARVLQELPLEPLPRPFPELMRELILGPTEKSDKSLLSAPAP